MPKNTGVVFICKLTNGQLIQRIVEQIAIFLNVLRFAKEGTNNTLIKNIFFSN